jgi:hypothetical protein
MKFIATTRMVLTQKQYPKKMGALPNDPAENAKKTSPEEDAGEKEDTRLSAENSD